MLATVGKTNQLTPVAAHALIIIRPVVSVAEYILIVLMATLIKPIVNNWAVGRLWAYAELRVCLVD